MSDTVNTAQNTDQDLLVNIPLTGPFAQPTKVLANFCYSIIASRISRDCKMLPTPGNLPTASYYVAIRKPNGDILACFCQRVPNQLEKSLKDTVKRCHLRVPTDVDEKTILDGDVEVGIIYDYEIMPPPPSYWSYDPHNDMIFMESPDDDDEAATMWASAYKPPCALRREGTYDLGVKERLREAGYRGAYNDSFWDKLRIVKARVARCSASWADYAKASGLSSTRADVVN